MKNSKNINAKAFSLVELMVAMGVIAILATLSIVAIQTVQRSLRDTQRRDVLNTANLNMTAFASNNNNTPEDGNNLYFADGVIFIDEDNDNTFDTGEFQIAETPAHTTVGSSGAFHPTDSTNPSTTNTNSTRYCYFADSSEFVFGTLLEDGGEFYIGAPRLETNCVL